MDKETVPKLYMVHVGFYDEVTSFGGVYEAHTNLFFVAETAQDARVKAKGLDVFKTKRMHIDGIQKIEAVDGYRVILEKDDSISNSTEITPYVFRDLASTS